MILPPVFAHEVVEARPRLIEILDRFSQARILLVGDLGLDEFVTGQVERLSREAPVLILRHEETRQVPGGGGNAAYNLAMLGASVQVVGLIGDDDHGRSLQRIFSQAEMNTEGVIVDAARPTVTKSRISGHARQSVTQQIVRIDYKSDALPSSELQHRLAELVRHRVHEVDCVVCADYGDGVFTPEVIKAAIAHRRVIVDAQVDLHRYAGATLFTPNLPEAEQAVGYAIGDRPTLYRAGTDLLTLTQAQHILMTQGEDGMTLFSQNTEPQSIPAFNRTDVFDVTGAGDTVTATVAIALSVGASPWDAMVLGNLAASLVVRQFGTATIATDDLKAALNQIVLRTIDTSPDAP
ncbi:MAG: PfkB family carbohydrate kinase [Elainellaceae cyanobacterium]